MENESKTQNIHILENIHEKSEFGLTGLPLLKENYSGNLLFRIDMSNVVNIIISVRAGKGFFLVVCLEALISFMLRTNDIAECCRILETLITYGLFDYPIAALAIILTTFLSHNR